MKILKECIELGNVCCSLQDIFIVVAVLLVLHDFEVLAVGDLPGDNVVQELHAVLLSKKMNVKLVMGH